MSNITTTLENTSVSVFGSADLFEQAQRMVKPLAQSTMVPESYRGNVPNCLVAMEMSHRINISVLEVMQNMQIVKGNVGWKSEYVINKINSSGKFTDSLDFVFSEDRQSCYAVATRKSIGREIQGTSVSMTMAKYEGWLDKNGSKWKTMPEQMLMYRAATFFCRVYCPEVLAGVQTSDEIIDIGITASGTTDSEAINSINSKIKSNTAPEKEYYEAEEVTDEEPIIISEAEEDDDF